ncbi:hypothetical protein [Labrenzia sp. CE80]|uniref:hypothetical protein n=1 Tax=Labrenzia sp. CE80 TaxID=1788986 RepID=UPI001930E906|nr:hypothetical protein [Labrenzia sp. CE80]
MGVASGGGERAVDPASARYRAAQQRALGFVWKSASDLLDHAPVDELLERLEALKSRPEAEV